MTEHRTAAKIIAGILLVSATVLGAAAPASADTGWNGTIAPAHR